MVSRDNSELVFVIETCINCKDHVWNTRHDEAKYQEFFNKVSTAIVARIPNALTMRNQIPKSYLPYDLYCNLIPNDDENVPFSQQVARTGAFEVSYKGLLIFSKLQGGYWPNCELVAQKCEAIVRDEAEGRDVSVHLAGNSPTKGVKKIRKTKPTAAPQQQPPAKQFVEHDQPLRQAEPEQQQPQQ